MKVKKDSVNKRRNRYIELQIIYHTIEINRITDSLNRITIELQILGIELP